MEFKSICVENLDNGHVDRVNLITGVFTTDEADAYLDKWGLRPTYRLVSMHLEHGDEAIDEHDLNKAFAALA